jgi:serine/threonine-protein kinase SRPK3
MKICSGNARGPGTQGYAFELKIIQHLTDTNPQHDGYKFVSTLQDSFTHQGVNGEHLCLVFKVMGETLETFVEWFDEQVPVPLVRSFVRQLLYALVYTHECGIVHCGTYVLGP